MDEALVDSHCVVRLVTAVEAVRRKKILFVVGKARAGKRAR